MNTLPMSLLVLRAAMAEDVMTPNPVSIRANATLREAAALLTDREISAAPVIDAAGRAVGVISRADLVRHEREAATSLPPASDVVPPSGKSLANGSHVETIDSTRVRDVMTPAVIAVAPDDSIVRVVADLLGFKVHRLFVVDSSGVLVGVISTFDVLHGLKLEDEEFGMMSPR